MLIYIENKELLTKILSYLDYQNKNYTLDINSEYEYVVISDINKRSLEISKGKKIILVTHLLEEKIYRVFTKNNKQNREFKNRLIRNIDTFYKVIVSLEAIKKLLLTKTSTNVITINEEIPTINLTNNKYLYDTYKIRKRRKNILFIDFNYDGINNIYQLSLKYPKYNFIYLGFKPYYNMTKKEKGIFDKLPNNIYQIKYYDLNIFCDILKISDFVINESNIMLDIKYLYAIFIMKKRFLTKNNILFDDLINSKHLYTYDDTKELLMKVSKILDDRLSNITENAYDYICDNAFTQISKKYSICLS